MLRALLEEALVEHVGEAAGGDLGLGLGVVVAMLQAQGAEGDRREIAQDDDAAEQRAGAFPQEGGDEVGSGGRHVGRSVQPATERLPV